MTTRRSLHRDEGGTLMVLYALMLFMLFAITAIAVDLGALRYDRRNSQTVADLAAAAGAADLVLDFGGTPRQACEAAWGYVQANMRERTSGTTTTPSCGSFPTELSDCPADTDLQVTGILPPYDVTITWPVSDGHATMGPSRGENHDGFRCERIAVELMRTRGFLFAPVIGTPSGKAGGWAVARGFAGGRTPEIASLMVLDRYGCNALEVKGGGTDPSRVWIRTVIWDDPKTAAVDPVELPGILTLDSEGDPNLVTSDNTRRCDQSGQAVLQVQNNAVTNGVRAGVIDDAGTVGGQGFINSHAMYEGNTATAYDPADVTAGLVVPKPIAGQRITRAPIDHRYNCKATYSVSDPDGAYDIDPCPEAGEIPAHIDNLVATINGLAAIDPGTGEPYWKAAGWNDYRDYVATNYPEFDTVKKQCAPSTSITLPAGDWWVDCPSDGTVPGLSGFEVGSGNTTTFQGGNVVFTGRVDIQGNFNASGGSAGAYLYIRNGAFRRGSQGAIDLDRIFVYLSGSLVGESGNPKALSFGAGSPPVRWVAPDNDDYPFDDLSLWSEADVQHELGGQANLNLEGVFFVPKAQFVYGGQGDQKQKKAQFITWRLLVSGQGKLDLTPDPDRSIAVPVLGVRLIR